MATKTSILLFYLRLSKNTQPVLRMGSYTALAIVNVAGVVLTFLNIFQCRPASAAFDGDGDGGGKCISLLTEFICSAPVNIVTDLAILALPLPVLTGMQLPSRQKTILVVTFLLGIFVTIVDVVRIYYLQQAISSVTTGRLSNPDSLFGDSLDFSWNASFALMWSAVEVNVGITCACIPTLKPLIVKILPALLMDPDRAGTKSGSASRTTGSGTGSGSGTNHRPADTASSSGGQGDPLCSVALSLEPAPQVWHSEMARGHGGQQEEAQAAVGPDLPRDGAGSGAEFRKRFRRSAGTGSSVYFGFVNLQRPKSMLATPVPDSWKYCTVVAVLFFLWGFSYGLLNTLNNAVAAVAGMSTAQTIGLTSAYFGGGYLFGPLLVGEWILRHDEHHRSLHHRRRQQPQPPAGTTQARRRRVDDSIGGFKATFIVGLCVYGIGTIMFWPSSVLLSFPGFLISSFVVGFGLAVLETAANPFLALCGPLEYAEVRLLLAQGLQGVGSVLSGLLAQKVLFVNLDGSSSSSSSSIIIGSSRNSSSTILLDTQWTYLAITLLCVVLALFFYYMPLPEVGDRELQEATSRLPVDGARPTVCGLQLRTVCLTLAVAAQWCYVAAQESMSIYFHTLMTSWAQTADGQGRKRHAVARVSTTSVSSGVDEAESDQPAGLALSVPNYLLIGHTAFCLSRFLAGYMVYLQVKRQRQWKKKQQGQNWLRLCWQLPMPRAMLAWYTGLAGLMALLAVVLPPGRNANLIAVPVVLFFFFEGPIWPLIFVMGLRGQGARTKRAAAFLTMGASGPLFWPFVMYGVMGDGSGSSGDGRVRAAFVVIVALMAAALVYPLYVICVRDAGRLTAVAGLYPDREKVSAEVGEGGGEGGGLRV